MFIELFLLIKLAQKKKKHNVDRATLLKIMLQKEVFAVMP